VVWGLNPSAVAGRLSLYGFLYCREAVIGQYHVGSKLGNTRVRVASHCHTNIGLFQHRCIIHAITGLGNSVSKANSLATQNLP